jgi:hypothetical protein
LKAEAERLLAPAKCLRAKKSRSNRGNAEEICAADIGCTAQSKAYLATWSRAAMRFAAKVHTCGKRGVGFN